MVIDGVVQVCIAVLPVGFGAGPFPVPSDVPTSRSPPPSVDTARLPQDEVFGWSVALV